MNTTIEQPTCTMLASDRHPVTQDPVEQRVIAACDTIRTYHARRPHDVARFVQEQLGDTGIILPKGYVDETIEQLEDARVEIEKQEERLGELYTELDDVKRERDTAERQLSAANETIRYLEHQLHLLRTEGGTIASEED